MTTQRARALRKHRLASDVYGVDFVDRLSGGESLTGAPAVVVTQEQVDGSFTDVSSQFGISGSQVSGTSVTFRLGAAGSGEQDAGEYVVQVRTGTSLGDTLVSTHVLHVTERGDPGAP